MGRSGRGIKTREERAQRTMVTIMGDMVVGDLQGLPEGRNENCTKMYNSVRKNVQLFHKKHIENSYMSVVEVRHQT